MDVMLFSCGRLYLIGYTGTVNAARKTIPKGADPYAEYEDDMAELAAYVVVFACNTQQSRWRRELCQTPAVHSEP